jgi:hypothetical protein
MKELPITIGNEADKPKRIMCRTFPHTIHFLFQKVTDFGGSLTRAVISSSLKPIAADPDGRGGFGKPTGVDRLPLAFRKKEYLSPAVEPAESPFPQRQEELLRTSEEMSLRRFIRPSRAASRVAR